MAILGRGAHLPGADQIERSAKFPIAGRYLRLFAAKPGRKPDQIRRVGDRYARSADKRGTSCDPGVAPMTIADRIESPAMKRLLREPLIHFLLLGAILFGLYGYADRGHGGVEQSKQI